jgi:hypothetical protein
MAEREMFNKPGPLIIDAQSAENWRKFLMRFEIYLIAKEKDEKPDKFKVNLLLNCAGSEAIEEYSHFVYNEEEVMRATKMCVRNSKSCAEEQEMLYMRDYCLINVTRKREKELTILLVT